MSLIEVVEQINTTDKLPQTEVQFICVSNPKWLIENPGSVVTESPCMCILLCYKTHDLYIFMTPSNNSQEQERG